MLSLERYFDNAATTPVDPKVVEAMAPFWTEVPGNPSSIHAFGIKARSAVTQAREKVAELIGADDPSQIVFTSGATEANNWVISLFEAGQVSPFEHPSVFEPAQIRGFTVAENEGYHLKWRSEQGLACCMAVSNETGALLEIPVSADRLLVDATQAVGKAAFKVGEADFVSFSSHKIYGPKGVGALYLRDPQKAKPLLVGGGQQHGLRSGTLNVAGIVGFGKAAELAQSRWAEDADHCRRLREIVLDTLDGCPQMMVHEPPKGVPHILSLSFEGIEGETLVLEADARGFAISSGAACSAEEKKPNRTLLALGVPTEWIRGTIRISFGRHNTVESAHLLASLVLETVKRLRKMRMFAQNAT